MDNIKLLIEQLEILSRKKVILVEEENIFIPRNIEARQIKAKQKTLKLLDQEIIEGDLDLSELNYITNLGNIKKVTGDLDLRNTKITSLPSGLEVGGYLGLSNTPITSLPNDLKVGGNLGLSNTPITNLPNNLKVGGSLYLIDTPITSLPSDLKVGGNLYLRNTPIADNKKLLKYYKTKYSIIS
jgi:hypothetical protein